MIDETLTPKQKLLKTLRESLDIHTERFEQLARVAINTARHPSYDLDDPNDYKEWVEDVLNTMGELQQQMRPLELAMRGIRDAYRVEGSPVAQPEPEQEPESEPVSKPRFVHHHDARGMGFHG